MTQDTSTYYVWIGGSCDYGHKERAGGAAVVIENNGNIISRDVISDLHATEFRMMLTLMIKVMQEIPEGSDILLAAEPRPLLPPCSRPPRKHLCSRTPPPRLCRSARLNRNSLHRKRKKSSAPRNRHCPRSLHSLHGSRRPGWNRWLRS